LLDKKVREVFGLIETKGTFGVEVEVEGSPRTEDLPNWNATRDGSLRGSGALEYVLRQPVSLDAAKKAVQDLYNNIKQSGGKIRRSMRAGIHVHVNCQDLTIRQLGTVIAAYYAFEEVLTERFGEDRVGNLFCLRLADAEYISTALHRAFVNKNFDSLTSDNIRYAAMNLNALSRYGSLEFRAMETPTTPGSILEWIDILARLRETHASFSDASDLLSAFSAGGIENAIDIIFGGGKEAALIRAVPGYEEKIYNGIRDTQYWVYSTDWK